MNKIYHFIVFSLLFVGSYMLNGQENTSSEWSSNFCAFISPQHAFTNTFRISIDQQLKDSPSWLIFSPSYISSYNDEIWGFNFDRRIGGGLTVSHRYFVTNNLPTTGVYLQYGLVYNYNQIQYEGLTWVSTDFDGIDAFTTESTSVKDHIHQYGFDLLLGYQTLRSEKLLVDFYLGIGNRNSNISTSAASSQVESGSASGILAPHFQGVLPIAGMRFGIWF